MSEELQLVKEFIETLRDRAVDNEDYGIASAMDIVLDFIESRF